MTRRVALVFLQWSVSIALLWYIFSRIDLAGVLHAAGRAQFILLFLGVLQLALQPLIGALRWRFVIESMGSVLRFRQALRFMWIGTFFSQALPGMVGGDAVRIWLYWRRGGGRRLAVNSVMLERSFMMITLFLMVAAFQAVQYWHGERPLEFWPAVLAFTAAFIIFGIIVFADRLASQLGDHLLSRALGHVAVDFRKALSQPKRILQITAASAAAYVNMAITVWLIALALNVDVALMDCIALVPIALLAAMIPVSAGGWGVREGAMIILFSHVGVAAADALTVSVLFGLSGILVSLPGAAMWLRVEQTPI